MITRPTPHFAPARNFPLCSWIETPVMRRSDLSTPRAGPLIIEEYDATCVVPPGARAELDAGGNILIELS